MSQLRPMGARLLSAELVAMKAWPSHSFTATPLSLLLSFVLEWKTAVAAKGMLSNPVPRQIVTLILANTTKIKI